MRKCALALLFVGAFALGHPAVSEAQLVLYDDFSSALINPDKWFGGEVTGGAANPTEEAVRLISNGQLELLLRQYGLSDSDVGSANGTIRLSAVNPSPITTMQASVTVKDVEVDTCSSTNTSGANVRARAQVWGGFFNDGTSPGSGDRTGDILAGLQMALIADDNSGAPGNFFQLFVARCTNSACSTVTFLNSAGNFTTTWSVGEAFTISIKWDQGNRQFVATVAQGTATETLTYSYSQSDTKAAVVPFRELRMYNSAVNCNGSQKHAFMDALFDTVMVNP